MPCAATQPDNRPLPGAAARPAWRRRLSTVTARLATCLLVSAQLPGVPLAEAADVTAAALYQGADLAEGSRLLAEHKCVACHQRKVGGDGSSIYRPKGRINTPAALRGMVEQCNTELNLAMFPDEVTSVAALLNRDHYHFR